MPRFRVRIIRQEIQEADVVAGDFEDAKNLAVRGFNLSYKSDKVINDSVEVISYMSDDYRSGKITHS